MALESLYEKANGETIMGILRDWLALPFVLIGALFYGIGEFISGKHFTRGSGMGIFDHAVEAQMNRHERRSQRHKKRRR